MIALLRMDGPRMSFNIRVSHIEQIRAGSSNMNNPSVGRIVAYSAVQTLSNRLAAGIPPPNAGAYNNGYGFEAPPTDDGYFAGVIPSMLRFFKFLLTISFISTISAASYGLFYQLCMPSRYATEPLFFDYSQSSQQVCHGNETCPASTSGPYASVDLFARHVSWEPLHPDVIPPGRATQRLLHAKVPYYLDVQLLLPESLMNQEAGIFVVEVELQSAKNGTRLALSKRSARFPHSSRWVSTVRKIVCLIPLLLGVLEESRSILIPSYHHFVESADAPLVSDVSAAV